MRFTLYIAFFLFVVIFSSCNNEPAMPKPKGQIRLQVPKATYLLFDTICPYTFKYPSYAKIKFDTDTLSEPYWLNIEFPLFNATLYISYKSIHNDLNRFLEDQRQFVNKHIPKANAIDNKVYANTKDNVFGMTYEIIGPGAASPYQFYMTDSTNHFLRGSIYFNQAPNNDSLAPIIQALKKDMEIMIETIKWK